MTEKVISLTLIGTYRCICLENRMVVVKFVLSMFMCYLRDSEVDKLELEFYIFIFYFFVIDFLTCMWYMDNLRDLYLAGNIFHHRKKCTIYSLGLAKM